MPRENMTDMVRTGTRVCAVGDHEPCCSVADGAQGSIYLLSKLCAISRVEIELIGVSMMHGVIRESPR